jgi:hypothetical protein
LLSLNLYFAKHATTMDMEGYWSGECLRNNYIDIKFQTRAKY